MRGNAGIVGRGVVTALAVLLAGLSSTADAAPGRNLILRPLGKSTTNTVKPGSPSEMKRPGFPCFLSPDGAAAPRGGRLRPLAEILPGSGASAPTRPAAASILDRAGLGEGVDTLRVAFLRCDFLTDRGGDSTTTPDGRFDLRTDVSQVVDPPPHNRAYFVSHAEALRRYYRAQSQGHLEIVSTVFPAEPESAFHLGDTMDYGPWAVVADNVDVAVQAENLIRDALEAARVTGQVNFQNFDAFIIVHAGADFQSDIDNDSPRDIPTFVLEFGDTVMVDGKHIERAMVLPETNSQDGFVGALNGVLAHEFGHILGLPDLYNTLYGYPVVGHWSLMDSGENIPAILVDASDSSEVEAVGALPTSFDAWSRLQLFGPPDSPGGGFLLDRVQSVRESLSTSLPAVLKNGDLISVDIHDTEYYLVENRAVDMDGNGFPIIRQDPVTGVILGPEADDELNPPNPDGALEYDALLPGGGVLIWHIDDRVLFGDLANPFGVNVNPFRRGVRLKEADGIDDLEYRNYGTPWDPYYLGNNSRLGAFTVPRSHSNDEQFTHITIDVTSPPGVLMNVSVVRRSAVAGWPIGVEQLAGEHANAADVTGDGSPEMLFVVDRAIFALEGQDGTPFPAPVGGSLVPLVQHTSRLDERLALGPITDMTTSETQTVIAAHAPVQGRIVVWNSEGELLGTMNGVTPPAIDGQFIVAGGVLGGVEIAAIEAGAVRPAFTSPAGTDRDAVGNILLGDLSGTGATEAVYSNRLGQVLVETTDGATAVPDGPDLLRSRGSSPSLGTAPLQLLAGNFGGPSTGAFRVAAVDPTGKVTLIDLDGNVLPGWPVQLPSPVTGFPAAGDFDGDGSAELVLLTIQPAPADSDSVGVLHVLNGDGSRALGFPVVLKARPVSGPLAADLDGRPGAEIIIMTDDGSLSAFTGAGTLLPGFPIAMGGWTLTAPMLLDFDADGDLDVAGTAHQLLHAVSLATFRPDSAVQWAGEQNGPARNAVLDRQPGSGGPLLAGRLDELVVFPNPARGEAMHVRLFLAANQSATADVFDMLGRPVAGSLTPVGGAAEGEADIVWPLGDVAPGIYMIRVTVNGNVNSEVRWRTVSVLQ